MQFIFDENYKNLCIIKEDLETQITLLKRHNEIDDKIKKKLIIQQYNKLKESNHLITNENSRLKLLVYRCVYFLYYFNDNKY